MLVCLVVVLSTTFIYFDFFEALYAHTRKFEEYEFDELIIIFTSILFGFSIYGLKKNKDLKKTEKHLLNIVEKDDLTLLKNRYAFFKEKNNDKKYLVLVNIIDFSIFNKHLGFEKADNLLKEIAQKLGILIDRKCGSELFRIYGDEFAFYCDQNNIETKLEELKNEFEEKVFHVDDYEFYIHLNIAYSSIEPRYLTASQALVSTRKSISKSILSYSPKADDKNDSLKMVQIIKESIQKGSVIPVYQGIHDNNTNKIYKYETLARIKRDEKLILPYQFIDISKRFKLYHKITQEIIFNAFEDFENNQKEFSINLSYIDIINKETRDFIIKMLVRHPHIGNRLTIEFLETENIMDYEVLLDFTREIRQFDTKIALDDFGAGYSNWNNILKLRPDFIKIDGSLIQNLIGNDKNINLIKLIVQFAKINDIKTIAEFVDTEEIANLITYLGIDYSQGFLFAKPQERHLLSQ